MAPKPKKVVCKIRSSELARMRTAAAADAIPDIVAVARASSVAFNAAIPNVVTAIGTSSTTTNATISDIVTTVGTPLAAIAAKIPLTNSHEITPTNVPTTSATSSTSLTSKHPTISASAFIEDSKRAKFIDH